MSGKQTKVVNRGAHPCLTNGESTFFLKEFILKPRKLEIARMTGTLQPKHDRNPILGEKSSRKDYSTWDFRPPTVDDQLKATLYDSTTDPDAKPLIAKFQSQKKKFQEEDDKKQNYRNTMTEFYESKRQLSQSISTIPFQSSKDLNYNHNQQSREQYADDFIQAGDANLKYAEVNANDSFCTQVESGRKTAFPGFIRSHREHPTVGLTTRRCATALTDLNVSSLKPLSTTHPEILSNWRAKRATEFIDTMKQREALKMDRSFSSSDLQMRSYSQLDNINADVMKAKLDKLNEELTKTSQVIHKQQLLIGLNSKKYGPNKLNTRTNSMSRSAKKTMQSTVGVTESARKYLAAGLP